MAGVEVLPAERGELAEDGGEAVVGRRQRARQRLRLRQDVAPDALHQQRIRVPRALHDRQLALPQVVAVRVLLIKLRI